MYSLKYKDFCFCEVSRGKFIQELEIFFLLTSLVQRGKYPLNRWCKIHSWLLSDFRLRVHIIWINRTPFRSFFMIMKLYIIVLWKISEVYFYGFIRVALRFYRCRLMKIGQWFVKSSSTTPEIYFREKFNQIVSNSDGLSLIAVGNLVKLFIWCIR